MEWLAAGLAGSLFSYNRENFFFDKERQQSREFQGQGMRIKQFELYREDVEDLIDLTVKKMDSYLLVNTFQLGFCVVLFAEGRPKGKEEELLRGFPAQSLQCLFAATAVSAFVYLLLSVWLAIHASIAAHSWGVRMLTQFVRLPVPNKAQLDAATATGRDYEAVRVEQMLRVPVLWQQLRRLNAVMEDLTEEGPEGEQRQDEDEDGEEGAGPGMLKHMRLYRQLQANWQAYDAYTRVSMAVGTNQLLHALGYYSLLMLLVMEHSPWPAVCCVIVFAITAWLLARLDLLLSRRMMLLAALLLLVPPLLTAASCIIQSIPTPREVDTVGIILVPVTFALHIAWMVFVLRVSQADQVGSVALPTNFRSVLYLDVFGWLHQSTEQRQQQPPPGAGTPHRLTARGLAGLPSVAEGEQSMVEAPSEPASTLAVDAMRTSLERLCRQLGRDLGADLQRWSSEKVATMMEDATTQQQVAQLCERFERLSADLRTLAPQDGPLEPSDQEAREVWLRLEWNPTGQTMEFFYCCENGLTRWTVPSPDCKHRVSDLRDMEPRLGEFAERIRALRDLVNEANSPEAVGPNGAVTRRTHQRRSAASTPWTSMGDSMLMGGERVAEEEDSPAQETAFGGREAVPLAELPQLQEAFVARSFSAPGATFIGGRRPDQPGRTRPPGQLPWRIFKQTSLLLMAVWVVKMLWFLDGARDELHKLWTHSKASESPEPQLAFEGPWPHRFFSPTGMACHGGASAATVLLAEKHDLHELHLERGGAWVLKPSAASACLKRSPGLVAAGIRDVAVHCGTPSREACSAVILAAAGNATLHCPLGPSANPEAPLGASTLYGGRWLSVSGDADGLQGLWALREDGGDLVRLGRLPGVAALAPRERLPLAAPAGTLHTFLEGHRLAVLERSGRLRVFALPSAGSDGAELWSTTLDHRARWSGLCGSGGDLFLTAGPPGGAALWRLRLPRRL